MTTSLTRKQIETILDSETAQLAVPTMAFPADDNGAWAVAVGAFKLDRRSTAHIQRLVDAGLVELDGAADYTVDEIAALTDAGRVVLTSQISGRDAALALAADEIKADEQAETAADEAATAAAALGEKARTNLTRSSIIGRTLRVTDPAAQMQLVEAGLADRFDDDGDPAYLRVSNSGLIARTHAREGRAAAAKLAAEIREH